MLFFFSSTKKRKSERRFARNADADAQPPSPFFSLLSSLFKKKTTSQQSETHFQKWRSETKTRVKRLQRFRDQARSWLNDAEGGRSDVCAPASVFSDLRRAVEAEMERVAEWESALKRGDFSNVALEAAARADALEAAEEEEAMSPMGAEGGGFSFEGGAGDSSGGVGSASDFPPPPPPPSSSFTPGDRIGRTKTTLLAAVLGGRHGETPQERARRRSCRWIVAAQAS